MYRYIAFAWGQQTGQTQSLANVLRQRLESMLSGWRCVLAEEGLYVYDIGEKTRSAQAYLLDQNEGVVLGKIFERRKSIDSNLHDVGFKRKETQRIQESRGRHLIEHYWGHYVAILHESDGTRVHILRDPTGAVPCLLTTFRGVSVICSHIEDCETVGLLDSTINWDHVAAYLWFRRLVTNQTGLDKVRQVRAGECVTLSSDGTTANFYWNPTSIHDLRIVDDHQEALQEMRATIQLCVAAWASCYNRLLHELSGGLDSAIVLACLSQTARSTEVVCENFFTQGTEGDERPFARLAANLAGVELIETPLRASSRRLENMVDSTKCATPMQTILVPEYQTGRERLLKARCIEAVFSGQGGDHFFQQMKTPLISAEYAWRHGLRPKLIDIAVDTSRLTGRSIWSIMATTITAGIFRQRKDPYEPWLQPPPFVSKAACDSLDLSNIRHPWVENAGDLPGSKILQIIDVIDSQNLAHLPPRYADIVHPLISQPIIELSLQIPSYHLTYGGIDRALVREAFAGVAPAEITKRITKGGTSSYVIGTLLANLPVLREFLSDGILVKEGILNRKKIDATLTESGLIRDQHLLFPTLSAIQAEAWVRTWIGESQRAAA